jgi:hypothetical protein
VTLASSGEGAVAGLFTHIVFKVLTAVEADSRRSNQHEFNASAGLRAAFGRAQPQALVTDFLWMPDDADWRRERGVLTWYDSRARHSTRSEYRLYYRDNDVTRRAGPGCLLLIARRPDGTVLVLLAPGTGKAAARIAWLFGIEALPGAGFTALTIEPQVRDGLARAFGARSVESEDWQTQSDPRVGTARPDVLAGARDAQSRIAGAFEAGDPGEDWDDLTISLPETAPAGVAGDGLSETIRGLVGRSRD